MWSNSTTNIQVLEMKTKIRFKWFFSRQFNGRNLPMLIYTIGFSKKSLRQLLTNCVTPGRKLIDVRLNNTSQLAGYAKEAWDLQFVLELVKINTNTIELAYRKTS